MTVHLEFVEDVAVITLDRPEVLNALSFDVIRDIGNRLDSVAGSDARALVITGTGPKAFCAGADIGELQGRSLAREREGAELGQRVFAKLDRMPMASIAFVDGLALGGGAELALACTFRVGSDRAKFGLPEVKLGLIPGYGGTQRLPRLVGQGRALELILTGRIVGIDEALTIGLVNRRGHTLEDVIAFSREFSRHGMLAQRFAREAVQRAADLSLDEGLRMEADLSTLSYRTRDAAEGMQAFIQKRPPRFHDA
jgi:enoyl-CoA hydratase